MYKIKKPLESGLRDSESLFPPEGENSYGEWISEETIELMDLFNVFMNDYV